MGFRPYSLLCNKTSQTQHKRPKLMVKAILNSPEHPKKYTHLERAKKRQRKKKRERIKNDKDRTKNRREQSSQ